MCSLNLQEVGEYETGSLGHYCFISGHYAGS
jgi:hypothetical protein